MGSGVCEIRNLTNREFVGSGVCGIRSLWDGEFVRWKIVRLAVCGIGSLLRVGKTGRLGVGEIGTYVVGEFEA